MIAPRLGSGGVADGFTGVEFRGLWLPRLIPNLKQ